MPRSHIAFSLLAAFLLSLSFAGCTKLPDDLEMVQLSEVEAIEPDNQPERAIKDIELREALESDPHHHVQARGDYLLLFRKYQNDEDSVSKAYFANLETCLIASETAAIRQARKSRNPPVAEGFETVHTGSTRSNQYISVVSLIRLEFDKEDFANAGDYVWQVRFYSPNTDNEVFVSSTTGKCISLFGRKPWPSQPQIPKRQDITLPR